MRVRFFASLRTITGCSEAEVQYEETIGALARSLCKLYGENLRKKIFPAESSGGEDAFGPNIILLINGRHVSHLGGPSALLKPDDRVDFFPVLAGG